MNPIKAKKTYFFVLVALVILFSLAALFVMGLGNPVVAVDDS